MSETQLPLNVAMSVTQKKHELIKKYQYFFPDDDKHKYFENQYIRSIWEILINGELSTDRTGTGTLRLTTGYRFKFNNLNIPLLRGKQVNPHNALTEVIWILTGKTDLAWLKENGVNYWDSWVKADGSFGPIYGQQFRNQNGFDQLLYVIETLNKNPFSRQALISLWYGSDLKDQALPPCHFLYHPLIINNVLHLHCGQRSSDSILGVPYDFQLFYFIQQILSFWTNTKPGNIIHNNHDYHLYINHLDAVDKYFDNYLNNPKNIDLSNTQIEFKLEFPEKPQETTSESITEWLYKFYELNKNFEHNYIKNETHYPLIKADVAV